MYWVQEEPEKKVWSFILPKLRDYNIQLLVEMKG